MSSALRTFLKTLPGVWVVAQSTSSKETLQDLEAYHFQLLLLDNDLANLPSIPGMPLTGLIRQIHDRFPDLSIIVFVGELEQIQLALDAGACQAILKGASTGELRSALDLLYLPRQTTPSTILP